MIAIQVQRRLSAGATLLFLLFAVSSVQAPAAETAPAFHLENSEGAPVSLAQYKGKVVLLNFWATWCGGCKLEIPWFMEFEKKYGRSGFVVIGIAMDDNGWRSVRPFIKAKGMNYPVVIGNDSLAKAYGLNAMPKIMLIGRDGRIVSSHIGVVNRAACEREIQVLLQRSR